MGTYNDIRKSKNIIKIISILLFISICFNVYQYKINNTNNINTDKPFIPIDTTYNKVILDSLEYNILYRDTIIYNIKQQIIEDEKTIISLDDSSTITLFFEYTRGSKSY